MASNALIFDSFSSLLEKFTWHRNPIIVVNPFEIVADVGPP